MAKSEMFGETDFLNLVTRCGLRSRFDQFFCSKTFSLALTRNAVCCSQFKTLAL